MGRSGTGTVNFNGGTLMAASPGSPTTGFLSGLTAANVQAGGAVINPDGYNISIGQNLLHDPGLGGTTDGGLTKSGSGTLLLASPQNAYTGGTTINAGEIKLSGSADNFPRCRSSAAGGRGGALTITSGTLDLNGQAQTVVLNGAAAP